MRRGRVALSVSHGAAVIERLFPDVRATELGRFRFFFFLSGLVLIGQTVGSTAAESLLLTRLGVQALPMTMTVASLVTMVGAGLYSRWVGRFRHEQTFLVLLALSALFLGGALVFVRADVDAVYVALFCFNWLSFTLFVSHFYTMAGDYFDTLAMKRLLPLFVVGATGGEIVGGFSASLVSRFWSAQGLLWAWIGCQALMGGFLWRYRHLLTQWNPPLERSSSNRVQVEVRPSTWAFFRRSPLARALAYMAAALMVTNTFVVYFHSDIFVAAFPGEGELAEFLGVFVAVTNIVELFLGAKVTPWLLRRLGVANANLIQPVGSVLTVTLLAFHYSLWPAMLAWMNRKMLQDSLASPTRALVYSAVPARFRGGVRATVDGVVGAGTQAVAAISLAFFQHRVPASTLVGVGISSACLYLLSAWRVQRLYLQTLVDDLSGNGLGLKAHGSLSVSVGRPPAPPPIYAGEASLERRLEDLKDRSENVVLAAMDSLRGSCDPMVSLALAERLQDPRPRVRRRAVSSVSQRGEAALSFVEVYFRSEKVWAVEAAFDAAAESGTAKGRFLLGQEMRFLVRQAWRHLAMAEAISGNTESKFLVYGLALIDHSERCRRLALKALSLLEGEHLLNPVVSSLRFSNAASRANAMEVLSNLGDREAAGLLVLLTETSPTDERLKIAVRLMPDLAFLASDSSGIVECGTHSCAPFVRRAALACRDQSTDLTLQRLALLKSNELFANLSFEELQEVDRSTTTHRFPDGDRIVTRGDAAERLYLRVDGQVEPSRDLFGVTPLLDGGTYREDVIARGTVTLWSMDRDRLHSLIRRFPEIGLSLFRRLTRQLKEQETRFAEQAASLSAPSTVGGIL